MLHASSRSRRGLGCARLGALLSAIVPFVALHNAAAPPPPAVKSAGTAPPKLIGLEEIKPGMTGYGLTVFQGTKPDRFPIKVIGILRNFLPKQDIILIESDDPRLKHTGIVAGMSGSPIYIGEGEGARLAGALAYGWHFAKDPVAGVTPIANMLGELRRPLRGREHTPVAAAANDARYQPRADHGGGDDPVAMQQMPKPIVPYSSDPSAPRLVPATVPLALSGFGPSMFNELSKVLEPYGIAPMAAGGGAPQIPSGPDHFEPGSAISVELIRGDMSAAGTGTVTYVDGDKVLAFGHPMFNIGEIYLPIATAEVHTVLASISSSFKMASPLREVGSLVQDRQSCIVGDTGQRTDMIPLTVKVGGPGKPDQIFHAEVIRHRFLTPLLASAVVGNAAQAAASDVADATITVKTSLGVRGFPALDLVDHAFSNDGFSTRALQSLSGIKAIGDLLFNPFAPANLDRIDVRVDVDYKSDVAEITGVTLDADTVDPGSRPSLRVTLRPYNGAEYTESIPISIPRALAGQLVKIEAAAGNLVKPDLAAPENMGHLIDNLRKSYPARSIVVTLQTPDEGLALRGTVVFDLPGSVMDTLRPGASTRRGETFKETSRQVVPTRVVVTGKQEIQVKIKDEPSR